VRRDSRASRNLIYTNILIFITASPECVGEREREKDSSPTPSGRLDVLHPPLNLLYSIKDAPSRQDVSPAEPISFRRPRRAEFIHPDRPAGSPSPTPPRIDLSDRVAGDDGNSIGLPGRAARIELIKTAARPPRRDSSGYS